MCLLRSLVQERFVYEIWDLITIDVVDNRIMTGTMDRQVRMAHQGYLEAVDHCGVRDRVAKGALGFRDLDPGIDPRVDRNETSPISPSKSDIRLLWHPRNGHLTTRQHSRLPSPVCRLCSSNNSSGSGMRL